MAPAAAAPLADDDLLGEVLLRLSPLPSSLIRASIISRRWERLATAAAFHRRFLAHHRKKPPILGVFEKLGSELVFSSVLDPPDRIPRQRFSLLLGVHPYDAAFRSWTLLGCRHGRVLIISSGFRRILVFDPISGDRHHVAVPRHFGNYAISIRGAVLCAAAGSNHVHGDCRSSPFKVVLVGTGSYPKRVIARVYSSETGMWGDLISMAEPCVGMVSHLPCILIGNALYWWLNESEDEILEFDLDIQRLAAVKRPTFAGVRSSCIRIIRAEGGGGVGIAVFSYPRFQIWDRKVSSHGVATWMLQKTVNMHRIIGLPSRIETGDEAIVGYSEEADAVFISMSSNSEHHAFIVQLDSMQSRKLNGSFVENSYHPFTNFYTPGTIRV